MATVMMDFDENDNPVISVEGVKGRACKELTADLERRLGKVTKEEKTREYTEAKATSEAKSSNNR